MTEALYRKYRPQVFEDVIGQEHIERTIKNAIDQDKLSHAYLFCGPRGTGKTTTARLLAKALLCEHAPTSSPDGTCDDCRMIAAGEHPDVYELDAASRTGVENVREEIIGRVQFAPTRGRYKVYIIDEVHMLSTAAFNALLKTLEEPPSHVVFILATTDPQKVPPTIQSRCQRFDFRRIAPEAMVSRLGAICVAEGVEFEGEALDLIAHRAGGGMRNALTSLDQMIAFGGGKVTLEAAEHLLGGVGTSDVATIARLIGARDVAGCFRWTSEFVETGADLAQLTRDLAQHVRNLYVMSLAGADAALEVGEADRLELSRELPLFGPDRLARMLCVLGDLSAELKTSTNARLSFEIALTRMVRPDADLTLESLAERVEALEAGHSAVAHVASSPVQAVAQPASSAAPAQLTPLQPIASSKLVPVVSLDRAASAPQPDVSAAASEGARPAAPSRSAQPSQDMPAGARVAAPAVAPSGGALSERLFASLRNPASLQRTWQAALSTLKRAKTAYGVLFLNTKVAFDPTTARLIIEFPAANEFAFGAAQKTEVREAVAQALAQATGENVPFSYSLGGKVEPPSTFSPSTTVASGRPAQAPSKAQAPAPAPMGPDARTQPRSQGDVPPRAFAAEPAIQAFAGHAPQVEPRPAMGAADPMGAVGGTGSAPAFDDDDRVPYDDVDVPETAQDDPDRFAASSSSAAGRASTASPNPAPARQAVLKGRPPAPRPAPQPVPAPSPRRAEASSSSPAADASRSAERPTDEWMADFVAGFGEVTFDEVRG